MSKQSIEDLIQKIIAFRDEREWAPFHNPKDLATALSIEASELQEIFLWKNAHEVAEVVSKKSDAIKDEVADVATFLLLLCHELDIDLAQAVTAKLEKSAAKYPVDKAKGTHAKYDEL